MAHIGGLTVFIIDGILQDGTPDKQVYRRPGVATLGFVFGAAIPRSQRLVTLAFFATGMLRDAEMVLYKGLERTNVTITDQFGRTWNNVVVEGVDMTPADGWDTGLGAYLVQASWTVTPET